ncbi:hypothetical protein [Thalassospira mesophila]|uniref:VanZ-like domain-containing protein n=1 Tax=Thalassospira mesophila TaxID=1293891 RepID=A0A1Y2L6N2_9PROT|nr:hypothetical protein [Thalassospira mesophila]OSQ40499.1 hypothetical protein TMES_01580 [Thalassospira mesophila]
MTVEATSGLMYCYFSLKTALPRNNPGIRYRVSPKYGAFMPEQTAQTSRDVQNGTGMEMDDTAFSPPHHNTSTQQSAGFMTTLKAWLYRYRVLLLLLWVLGLVAIGYAGVERRFAVTDRHNLDKVVHVSVFAAMAFWPIMVCGRRLISVFFVIIVALGAPGLELMQAHFGNGRIASLADMSASLSGVAVGVIIAICLRRA